MRFACDSHIKITKKCFIFLGESCNTHNNLSGICVELPSCQSLIQLYRNDRSQRTIDILVANQQSCGNRKVDRNPLMCCSDGVEQQNSQPPPPPQELNSRGPACTSPDNLEGFCINVKECPAVLEEFLKRRNDPEYVRYIQQSNANCNYERQAICCPNQSPPPQNQQNSQQPTSSNTVSRLALPDQCGVSKVPHNRVVGGVPAKKGKKRVIYIRVKFNDIDVDLLLGIP